MCGQRHAFLATGQHDAGIAQDHLLGGQRHGAQTRAADLVDAPGRGFLRKAGLDMGLTGGVLPLGCGQDLAQDRLVDLGGVDAGAPDDLGQDGRAQIVRRNISKGPQKTPDRGTGGGNDYGFGHDRLLPIIAGRTGLRSGCCFVTQGQAQA